MKKLRLLPYKKINEFAELYYARLTVPKENLYKPFLICPVGKIAAGKTTMMKILATELGIPRVSSDEIRILLRIENDFISNEYKKILPIVVERLLNRKQALILDCD